MSIPGGHYATVKRDAAGGWRYRVFAGLENIDTSESYTRRASAIRAVKRNRPDVGGVQVFNRRGKIDRVISLGGAHA